MSGVAPVSSLSLTKKLRPSKNGPPEVPYVGVALNQSIVAVCSSVTKKENIGDSWRVRAGQSIDLIALYDN